MRGLSRFHSTALMVTVLLIVMPACNTARRDYEAAIKGGTSDSYSAFLAKHPASQYTGDVQKRLEDLVWRDCERGAIDTCYRDYVARFPKGEHTTLAQKKLGETVLLSFSFDIRGRFRFGPVEEQLFDGPMNNALFMPTRPAKPDGTLRSVTVGGKAVTLVTTALRAGRISTKEFGELEAAVFAADFERDMWIWLVYGTRLQRIAIENWLKHNK